MTSPKTWSRFTSTRSHRMRDGTTLRKTEPVKGSALAERNAQPVVDCAKANKLARRSPRDAGVRGISEQWAAICIMIVEDISARSGPLLRWIAFPQRDWTSSVPADTGSEHVGRVQTEATRMSPKHASVNGAELPFREAIREPKEAKNSFYDAPPRDRNFKNAVTRARVKWTGTASLIDKGRRSAQTETEARPDQHETGRPRKNGRRDRAQGGNRGRRYHGRATFRRIALRPELSACRIARCRRGKLKPCVFCAKVPPRRMPSDQDELWTLSALASIELQRRSGLMSHNRRDMSGKSSRRRIWKRIAKYSNFGRKGAVSCPATQESGDRDAVGTAVDGTNFSFKTVWEKGKELFGVKGKDEVRRSKHGNDHKLTAQRAAKWVKGVK
ncbi:hypothetical protein CONPUDRAFT_68687 [Coniophora puteana RWD-64-598 SS2]|uniref:Uncharacterized protein n=1 Tax=Coniophora puteana (strain RWD-64-598) TaxID=741705 RepID=A0A5M3N5E2_CONPW|nr:uncharacterized protein CONPUDRAFT_68687 [Coniophora puteana RWD-64-598 SS2]EIW86075.1 hypothetical protein CONPUDRAFT_68687 [Coniophora puteana RWD-64-598 SS2]